MYETVKSELNRFERFMSWGRAPNITIKKICEFGCILSPTQSSLSLRNNKEIGLTLMGITHGNEVAGLAVLNELFAAILQGVITLDFPIALLLGNPNAALKNTRFVERDLNRSFMNSDTQKAEEKRARELEKILRKTLLFLDFHQTSEPSSTPFFIFPYSEGGFQFARTIETNIPIVTHWGDDFSKEGRCTDEFVNSEGGTGITIELGQNGFHPYHVAAGFKIAVRSLMAAKTYIAQEGFPADETLSTAQIYTWADVLEYPREAIMTPGYINFADVNKGDELGVLDKKKIPAPSSGKILFPKYKRSETEPAQIEICRILKRIPFDAIGKP
ncbi:MAG: succinylglutamate desuccinylase/aspartoacylase family protein [Oligoflexales bacterium]